MGSPVVTVTACVGLSLASYDEWITVLAIRTLEPFYERVLPVAEIRCFPVMKREELECLI